MATSESTTDSAGPKSSDGGELLRGFLTVIEDDFAKLAVLYLVLLGALAVVGPAITPYQYDEYLYDENDELLRAAPPSAAHPLGTTISGQDVLSRILTGVRPSVLTGLIGGTMIISIGMAVGITSGYVGGTVGNVLMRITDFVYSVPLLPFGIVLLGLVDLGFVSSVIVIGLVLWRSSARVIRSKVLQIKERPFVMAARADGAGRLRIIFKHIVPNIAPLAVLYFALGIGHSILVQAGLAFVGVVNPFVPSWGVMLRNAFQSGAITTAWWWSIPPGLMISFTVMSTFYLGRRYESLSGQDPDSVRLAEG